MAKKKLDNIVEENAPRSAPALSSGNVGNAENSGSIDDKVAGKRNFYNKSLVGKLFDYGIGLAAAAGATALMGPIALVGPATSILGDYIVNRKRGKKLSSRQVRDNMIIGSIMSIPAIFGFNLMNKCIPMATWAGKLTRAAVQTVPFYLTMMPLGYAVDYLVRPHKNKSLDNMWEKGIKPYWWRNYKDGTPRFLVPDQLIANFTPPIFHYPASRILSLIYRTTIGQRHITELDPYDLKNNNGNGADIEKKSKPNHAPKLPTNYGPAPGMQPGYKPA